MTACKEADLYNSDAAMNDRQSPPASDITVNETLLAISALNTLQGATGQWSDKTEGSRPIRVKVDTFQKSRIPSDSPEETCPPLSWAIASVYNAEDVDNKGAYFSPFPNHPSLTILQLQNVSTPMGPTVVWIVVVVLCLRDPTKL